TPIAARNIMTVPLDAGIPTTPTPLIYFNDFSDAGVKTMTSYMKLAGVNSDFCQSMALTSRTAYATKEDCGQDTMKFMEGRDVLHQSNDGGVVRPNVMGDIFHSSPILVTPPAPPFLCETGIITQCVRTLYAEDAPCLAGGGPCTPGSKAAYATYFANNANRQELILVGANDGMLHAFQAGTSTGDAGFDEGTGVEVWSFIPSDMLPKLQRYVLGGSHQILLDGSPWVRDIWVDGSGSSAKNSQKDADEFHTVVIIGERGGGRPYTALDVTDTNAPDGGSGGPKFLWTWPPIGSNIELAEGESWNDTTPNPPPIGPVIMNNSTGPIKLNAAFGSTNVTGRGEERWVVAIAGGYDPNLVRGRAIYILDAWTGEELYQFSRYDHAGTCSGFPECTLGPVASPVSLIDTNFDNFFDVGVFGDTEGNVWTVDMIKPGGTLASPTWFGGLAFQQKPGSTSKLSDRSPFFEMPGARVFDDSKGGPRIYLGAGDRDQIRVRDTDVADGGTCQVDNLRGCIRNGCTVDVNQTTFQIGSGGSAQTFTGEWKFSNGGTTLNPNTFTVGTTTGAGACTDPAQELIKYQVTCPGSVTMQDIGDGGSTVINSVYCDFDGGNDAGEECPDISGKPIGDSVAFATQTVTNSRFYSLKLFDAPTYSTTTRPRMIDTTTQATYTSHALDDSKLTNADSPDGGTGGWYVQHSNDSNEKTASSALLLGGCVAWNTLVAQNMPTDGGQTCGGGFIPASTAYLYQANDDTGGIKCGLPGSNTQLATVRFQQRMVAETVPQQPTPVVSLNAKTGQAGYSGVSLEPGGKIPLQVSVGAASVQGDVSWLDVSRNLHNCRHPSDGGTAVCN
ncbi:MAG: PilC/PilY family type IV pilus protein, partial [Myxococcales bacterium]